MPPKRNPEPKAVTGPPRELIARIEHLQSLLCNLPTSLPENPIDSTYRFYLEDEKLEDRGYLGELSHALEVSFATHELRGAPIRFLQRGTSLDVLPAMLKTAVKKMTDKDREAFRTAWLERLITAAVASGATVPPRAVKRKAPESDDIEELPTAKKKKPTVIVLDDSDMETDPPPAPLLPPVATSLPPLPPIPSTSSTAVSTPVGNPKQSTLHVFHFKPGTKEDVQRYWTNVVANGAEKRKAAVEDDAVRAEKKKEHERELGRERKRKERERKKEQLPRKTMSCQTPRIRAKS
ncbi:hypothetical protein B0H10DRAFT_1955972 [Mycena sp. CBHHK59/15]|nr:hypothetical protein B0H10DRAFT_1955972 [Mycena sp. CBHHK59/15]